MSPQVRHSAKITMTAKTRRAWDSLVWAWGDIWTEFTKSMKELTDGIESLVAALEPTKKPPYPGAEPGYPLRGRGRHVAQSRAVGSKRLPPW